MMKQEAAEVAKKGLDTDPKFAQDGVDLTFCSVVELLDYACAFTTALYINGKRGLDTGGGDHGDEAKRGGAATPRGGSKRDFSTTTHHGCAVSAAGGGRPRRRGSAVPRPSTTHPLGSVSALPASVAAGWPPYE